MSDVSQTPHAAAAMTNPSSCADPAAIWTAPQTPATRELQSADTRTAKGTDHATDSAIGAGVGIGTGNGAADDVADAWEAALAMFRHREGLDPDAVILAAPFPVPPIPRMPPHALALEVDDVEVFAVPRDLFAVPRDPDVAPEVALFVGHWRPDPNPTGAHPTGVVVRLTPATDNTDTHDTDTHDAVPDGARVDVTALRAVQNVWRRVGRWPAVGRTGPTSSRPPSPPCSTTRPRFATGAPAPPTPTASPVTPRAPHTRRFTG